MTSREWTTSEGAFTSRPLSKAEAIGLKASHGIIDDDVLGELRLLPLRGEKRIKRAVCTLFALGFGVEAIEDHFGMTTREVHALVSDIFDPTIRAWYAFGIPNATIAERADVSLATIMKITRDIAKHPRGHGVPKMSADEKSAIRELRAEGFTLRKIAEASGRNRCAVAALLRRKETDMFTRKTTDAQIETIRALYTEGKTLPVIAATVGVSLGTVGRYVRDLPGRSSLKGRKHATTTPADAPPHEAT